MSKISLTHTQERALKIFITLSTKKGVAPTILELSKALKTGSENARRYMIALVGKGKLKKIKSKARKYILK